MISDIDDLKCGGVELRKQGEGGPEANRHRAAQGQARDVGRSAGAIQDFRRADHRGGGA
jgi:hypothetical protein